MHVDSTKNSIVAWWGDLVLNTRCIKSWRLTFWACWLLTWALCRAVWCAWPLTRWRHAHVDSAACAGTGDRKVAAKHEKTKLHKLHYMSTLYNQTNTCMYEYLQGYTLVWTIWRRVGNWVAHQALRRHRRPDDAVVGLVERIHKLVDLLGPIDVRPWHA